MHVCTLSMCLEKLNFEKMMCYKMTGLKKLNFEKMMCYKITGSAYVRRVLDALRKLLSTRLVALFFFSRA